MKSGGKPYVAVEIGGKRRETVGNSSERLKMMRNVEE